MSWRAVRDWRDRLRSVDAGSLQTGLSAQGAREALSVALNALSDAALAEAAALPVQPVDHAVVVPASTVFTAPLEWCAVLLGRGSRVTVKRPRARAGLVDAMVELAGPLPLSATDDRRVVGAADLVVVMGTGSTVEAIRQELRPDARLAAHGHAWSLAWVTTEEGWAAVAGDAALHDGRGCLSPSVVLTPEPLGQAVQALGRAMAQAEARWPVGEVEPAEGARIRERRALARVLGATAEGPGWAVHGLPLEHVTPVGLPRAPVVASVGGLDEALSFVGRWPGLSTVGTDGPAEPWRAVAASRVCPLGQMQRPPLRRLHDGVDWVLEETGRAP